MIDTNYEIPERKTSHNPNQSQRTDVEHGNFSDNRNSDDYQNSITTVPNSKGKGRVSVDGNRYPSPINHRDNKTEISLPSLIAVPSEEKMSKGVSYILLFGNICRSFIAIGILTIPFGLSQIGNIFYYIKLSEGLI